jgi:branched-chain amino acid transport system ATP-binding protein
MLEIKALSAFYGDVQVLWDVALDVQAGEIVSVIGPNGAGKSTLLKAIMGLVRPRGASGPAVWFHDRPLDGLAAEEIVRRGLTLVPEGARVFPEMSCLDNLKLGAYAVSDRRRHDRLLDEVFELFPRLKERRGQKASTLSGGERQMLAMGRALMMDPTVLLLDEPSAGLSPANQEMVFARVRDVCDAGVSVVMVEQNAQRCLQICDRGYVLDQGTNAYSDTGKNLLHDPKVIELYLGTLATVD